ncbi:cholesterol esterase [Coemansia aciculifera]|uniref:Cholesterol esterase n=1 Tax=Coemansia aciculifera TaxID=417176 RepID=A0A9W8M4Y0_9FUNG|nr:cholesterol esterase [Coemansia aciculifera]KAJ2873816.1 cholesterol esterase [Coemansia aciculifera]
MPYIPFFSRLSLSEYQGMLIAALFFIVEKFLRVFLVVFPIGFVVGLLPEWTFSWLKIPQLFGTDKEAEVEFLDDFTSFAEIVEYWGYPHEDHLVETRDGFILGAHRITGPRVFGRGSASQSAEGADKQSTSHTPPVGGGRVKPVVLFWHGFMLSSECFVCHPDWINILPFRLAEAGYDVWLGNSRGNKYSYKHMRYAPDDRRFWDFSIDEIANIDVPTTVSYILKETGASSLTYIGFSQGSAQMLMALSRNKELNSQVEHFIALAPASTPRGFHNSIVDYFIKATPHMLYLLFGRKRAMTLVYFWIGLLPRDLYVAALDFSVNLLFGWTMRNLSQETKCITYWHLYSYTSVKAIVHWMQIIRCGELQMYDEDPPVYPLLWSSQSQMMAPEIVEQSAYSGVGRYKDGPNTNPALHDFSRPASIPVSNKGGRRRRRVKGVLAHWNNTYPLKKITTRISLFHGGSDSLSSVDVLLEDLNVVPHETLCFPHYEHLDFLWADTVGSLVYPKVLALLGARDSSSAPPESHSLGLMSDSDVVQSLIGPENIDISDDDDEATGSSRHFSHHRLMLTPVTDRSPMLRKRSLSRRRVSSVSSIPSALN